LLFTRDSLLVQRFEKIARILRLFPRHLGGWIRWSAAEFHGFLRRRSLLLLLRLQ
jgi:hypothetical protein